MSIASVTHGHVLGIKKNVKENLFFADESTIIYPAGNNLIVSNIEQKSQRVVPVVAGPETITALALAPDRHIFAVGEKGERPSITVYDLPNFRKRRTLMATGDGSQISKSFTSIAFSYDSKYVAAQMGGPEWLLHFYSWEKGKLVAVECTYTATTIKRVESSDSSGKSDQQQQGGILQIGINPEDGTEISVLTESALNLYKYSEGTLRPKNIPIRLKVFSCHSWLTGERLAIGTRDSYVLIVDRRGTVGEIAVDFSRTTPHSNSFLHPNLIHTRSNVSEISTHSMSEIHDIGASTLARTEVCVTSLVPTSRAIIVGGNAGMVCVYEHSIPTQGDPVELHESHDVSIVVRAPSVSGSSAYRLAKRLFLPSDDPIPEVQALAVSASEGHVVIGLTTSQIFLGTLSSTQSAPTTNLAMPTGGGGVKGQPTDLQEQKCEPVSQPYHHGAITGLGTCCRRPLMISCSADRSIRIWNYMTGVCELVKYFPEEPHSVSLHPSGLYVLAGFSDKLRLMNLLIDDLRLFREFSVRGCRECKFSNGGHMFAAVHGNMIQLYSTWTFETIANLKGHNGKVRSLYWSPDDSVLVSAGQDGAVYTWNVMEFKRENEYILKGCSYTSAVCTPNGRVVYAVGSDRLLKEISDSTVTSEAEANTVLTQLAISQSGRMMFAGTSYGAIRSLRFPPVAVNDHEHQEHIAHSGAVTKFCISSDDGFLFSGSEDGCLLIFKISAREDRKRERSQVFADEILITRSDLEEKTVVMTELKRTLEELKLEHEYQLRLKDMNYNEKIKEITEKCSQEIEALKISTSVLRSEKDREEVKQQDELMQMRTNFAQELHDVEAKYNHELMQEYEKFQSLQASSTVLQEKWEKDLNGLQIQMQRNLATAQARFEESLLAKCAEIDQLHDDIRRQLKEFDEMTKQNEQDLDQEIQNLEARYDKKLKAEREESARLKGENGIMRKKFNTLNKDIDDNKLELQRMVDDAKKLRAVVASLEKDVAHLKKEMSERELVIQDKERRVYDLKKKNQELEKYKFVLDFRIKELKEQVEPREQTIVDMTTQIREIDSELQVLSKENGQAEKTITALQTRLNRAKDTYAREHQRVKDLLHYIKGFLRDFQDAIEYIQEPSVLQKCVQNLFIKFCGKENEEDLKDQGIDPDVKRECLEQQETLKQKIGEVRKQVQENFQEFGGDTMKSITLNQNLISEVNRIRYEVRSRPKQATSTKLSRTITQIPARNVSAQQTFANRKKPVEVLAVSTTRRAKANALLPPVGAFQNVLANP